MALNSLKVMLGMALAMGIAFANDPVVHEMNKEYLSLKKVKVVKVTTDVLNQEISEILSESDIEEYAQRELPGMPNKAGQVNLANVGQVISIGKDLVALGEGIYSLVQKGKPSNKTTYAPISVLPRIGNQFVDILDTESWQMPRKATYQIIYTNYLGMDVVKFRYSVIFAYGGSYNGAGAYITAAQIVPESIMTSFGFDFSATMKMGGMMNHGTKANPVAGAILNMQYEVSTVLQASLETATYHITGKGGFKSI